MRTKHRRRAIRDLQDVQGDVVFLVLRRMRGPLLTLVTVFLISVVGLALIPGSDANGEPTKPLSVFEAFFVVLYTATTIGFGEIPAPFNTAQRMWMSVVILITVATWTGSILALLALVQDKNFLYALRAARFATRMKSLREPFYIVCGAGETGALLMRGLDHLGMRYVVVDANEEQLNLLRMHDLATSAPAMVGDAGLPTTLLDAGLLNKQCRGVVALASDDNANRAIAVTARLLAPKVPVLARIRDASFETHIGVFGGDIVINPFKQFATAMVNSISRPQRHLLRQILTGLPGEPIDELERPPAGHWIVCGYGRQGSETVKRLREAGMTVSVIAEGDYVEGEVDVKGSGASSEELKAAGIEDAVGMVTATDSDTKNLAIAVTARQINHDLFLVVRQNRVANTPLFDAADYDMLLDPAQLVAQEFLARMATPTLGRFLRHTDQLSEADCEKLSQTLAALDPGHNPHLWDFAINAQATPAVADRISAGVPVLLKDLVADPDDRDQQLSALVLLVRRAGHSELLPADDFELELDDRILIAGSEEASRLSSFVLRNINDLNYVQTGVSSSGGWLWRKLSNKAFDRGDLLAAQADADHLDGELAAEDEVRLDADPLTDDDTSHAELTEGLPPAKEAIADDPQQTGPIDPGDSADVR